MQFITLTHYKSNAAFCVNVDHIVRFASIFGGKGTELYLTSETITVNEPCGDIVEMIKTEGSI